MTGEGIALCMESCSFSSSSLAASNHSANYRPIHQPTLKKGSIPMSRNELIAKIEALNEWEAMMEEAKTEADAIRSSIKQKWRNAV